MKNKTLKDTVDEMTSKDYKERFKAEYDQLAIRMEGLSNMLHKMKEGTLEFTPSCSYDLLASQLVAMEKYKHILEVRADIENIEL